MSESDKTIESTVRANLLQTGMFFASRYRILKCLGEGPMSRIYLASDMANQNSEVALKLINNDLTSDPMYLQNFLSEIRLAQKISHPNVIRTIDAAQHEGICYLTMEPVEGQKLNEMLAGKACSLGKCLKIITDICHGLSAIHAAGIVHRDLKSSNILITTSGTAKIADFGVAHPDLSNLTIPEELTGSATHMAPEIWKQTAISKSTDIYSLGVVLYELLTGRLPFEAKTNYELMWNHLKSMPISPLRVNQQIPGWLSDLCLSMLNKKPSERPQTAGQILKILESNTHRSDPAKSQEKPVKDLKPARSASGPLPKSLALIENIDIWAPATAIKPGPDSKNRPLSDNMRVEFSEPYPEDIRKYGGDFISDTVDYDSNNMFRHKNPISSKLPLSLITAFALLLLTVILSQKITLFFADRILNYSALDAAFYGAVFAFLLGFVSLPHFFVIYSAKKGIIRALKALVKISALSSLIFIFIFSAKLFVISAASQSSQQEDSGLEVLSSMDASLVNLSEILLLQPDSSSFEISLDKSRNSYRYKASAEPSMPGAIGHIFFSTILLLICLKMLQKDQESASGRGFPLQIVIPIGVFWMSACFFSFFPAQQSALHLNLGELSLDISSQNLITIIAVWSSTLLCELLVAYPNMPLTLSKKPSSESFT